MKIQQLLKVTNITYLAASLWQHRRENTSLPELTFPYISYICHFFISLNISVKCISTKLGIQIQNGWLSFTNEGQIFVKMNLIECCRLKMGNATSTCEATTVPLHLEYIHIQRQKSQIYSCSTSFSSRTVHALNFKEMGSSFCVQCRSYLNIPFTLGQLVLFW